LAIRVSGVDETDIITLSRSFRNLEYLGIVSSFSDAQKGKVLEALEGSPLEIDLL
jgi:hypothetical protein